MHRLTASTFGLGLIPRRLWGSDAGAGTFGAAFAWVLGGALLWAEAAWWWTAAAAALATAASLWAARPFAPEGDPGWICMDETAGTLLALIGLGGWPWVAAAAVARAADIWKVLPGVRAAERLPGAVGITADDLAAGLYGLGVGWLLRALGL
ncbi:MAG: phosphatidylglycerophosphatase A [Actinobacteria bacterium]|nr:phosphatidylglycerophosphatase A [Actinomycetota bacterium]